MPVDIAGVHDWDNGAARDADLEIGDILGHPVVITQCPPGQERLVPGEQVWALTLKPHHHLLAANPATGVYDTNSFRYALAQPVECSLL